MKKLPLLRGVLLGIAVTWVLVEFLFLGLNSFVGVPLGRYPCFWCARLRQTRALMPDPRYGVVPPTPFIPHRFYPGIPGNEGKSWRAKTEPKNFVSMSPGGFLWPQPGKRFVAERTRRNGDRIYRVRYSIDRFRRRTVPAAEGEAFGKRRRQFFLFLGCSYTFGEALEDVDTFPNQFALRTRDFLPYNYGFSGYGPPSIYLRLKNARLRDEIPERSGAAAYFFINDHLNRAFGTMSAVSSWAGELPYLTEDALGQFTHKGSFDDGRPVLDAVYRLLSLSQVLRYFGTEVPIRISDEQLQTFARMIGAIRDEVRTQLGTDRFFFVSVPGNDASRLLWPFLERERIRYVDFSSWNMMDLTEGQASVRWDGHPSPRFNEVFGRALAARSW